MTVLHFALHTLPGGPLTLPCLTVTSCCHLCIGKSFYLSDVCLTLRKHAFLYEIFPGLGPYAHNTQTSLMITRLMECIACYLPDASRSRKAAPQTTQASGNGSAWWLQVKTNISNCGVQDAARATKLDISTRESADSCLAACRFATNAAHRESWFSMCAHEYKGHLKCIDF